jgi:hypothetical protein
LPFKCNLQRYTEAALKGLDRETTPLVVTFANKAGLCTLNQVDP